MLSEISYSQGNQHYVSPFILISIGKANSERQGRMTAAEDWREGCGVSIVFSIIVRMLNCGIYVYVYYICAIYMHENIVYTQC